LERAFLKAVFFCCLLFPPGLAFAQSQKVIPLSSELYAEMDALYVLCGMAAPSAARPWTVAEAGAILQRTDGAGDSPAVQNLYDRIAAELAVPLRFNLDDLARLDLRLDIALEAYAHTNGDDYALESDWLYGYEERKPLLKLSLEMGTASWLYITTDMQYGRNRFDERDLRRDTADLTGGIGAVIPPADPNAESRAFPYMSWAYSRPFITNVPVSFDEFDFDWPKRAGITLGGEHWDFSIARDRIQWGHGRTGNFVFDDHRDYDDYFRLSAFTEKFKYQWLNVFYDLPDFGGAGGFKFLMAHRLEFRLLPSLVFAVSENLMVDPAGFSPDKINPAYIYHNWYDRSHFNALAQLELDFVPAKGWRLYTEGVIDQIQAFWESNDEPGSWGILAGTEYTRFAGPGLLTLSFEGVYTSPLLYRRDKVDFITAASVRVNGSKDNLFFDYIGYPYGGDALILQFDSSYRFIGGAAFSAGLFGMIHGRMNPFVSHNEEGNNAGLANAPGRTPSGGRDERELSLGVSLRGNYTLPKKVSVLNISVWAGVDFIAKRNKLQVSPDGVGEAVVYHKSGAAADFQISAGIGASL
jgi:hypothetical protein